MRKIMICTVCCLITLLGSCRGTPDESVTEVENGPFKILVRSQEFHKSGIHNVDICVTETSNREFPKNKLQCFFHGFDFSELSAKCRRPPQIALSFPCLAATHF